MDHDWHPNDLSMKKIIEQRKVFVSDKWVCSHETTSQGVSLRRIWFHPKNKKEQTETLQQNRFSRLKQITSDARFHSHTVHFF